MGPSPSPSFTTPPTPQQLLNPVKVLWDVTLEFHPLSVHTVPLIPTLISSRLITGTASYLALYLSPQPPLSICPSFCLFFPFDGVSNYVVLAGLKLTECWIKGI